MRRLLNKKTFALLSLLKKTVITFSKQSNSASCDLIQVNNLTNLDKNIKTKCIIA